MKKLIILLALTALMSGCLCCGDLKIPGIPGDDDGYEDLCQSPFIQVGSDCCLDYDYNGICDSDEQEQTTTTWAQTTTPQQTTQTVKATTTIQQTQTTTTQSNPRASTYECVKNTGYEADGVLFFYSTHCGDNFIATASNTAVRTGVDITAVKIGGELDDSKLKMMECFYGKYSETTKFTFGMCPRLLCPKTGEIKDLSGMGSATVNSQMSGFAKSCN